MFAVVQMVLCSQCRSLFLLRKSPKIILAAQTVKGMLRKLALICCGL